MVPGGADDLGAEAGDVAEAMCAATARKWVRIPAWPADWTDQSGMAANYSE